MNLFSSFFFLIVLIFYDSSLVIHLLDTLSVGQVVPPPFVTGIKSWIGCDWHNGRVPFL